MPAALTAKSASACSIAVDNPSQYTARLPQVARLFEAWFSRDELGFLGPLVTPINTNGIEPDEPTLRRYIEIASDSDARKLFDTRFVEDAALRRVAVMTAIGDRIFVGVDEQPAGGVGSDCSGMPTLHLFLVYYEFSRPRRIEPIGEDIWTGYGQVAHWAGR